MITIDVDFATLQKVESIKEHLWPNNNLLGVNKKLFKVLKEYYLNLTVGQTREQWYRPIVIDEWQRIFLFVADKALLQPMLKLWKLLFELQEVALGKNRDY